MSLLIQTSPKHCANRGFQLKKILNKKLLYALSTFISSILFILLLVCLILHPSKPQFYLKGVDLALSASAPRGLLLNSTVQVTLLSKNPNTKVGIYYEDVRAYAVYKGQQITADSSLPSFYQGNGDANLLSTSLYGAGMPVAASVGYEVGRDQVAGRMVLSVRIDGRLRWKVGSWVSGRYRFDVDCVAVVGLRPGGGPTGSAVQEGSQCSTTV